MYTHYKKTEKKRERESFCHGQCAVCVVSVWRVVVPFFWFSCTGWREREALQERNDSLFVKRTTTLLLWVLWVLWLLDDDYDYDDDVDVDDDDNFVDLEGQWTRTNARMGHPERQSLLFLLNLASQYNETRKTFRGPVPFFVAIAMQEQWLHQLGCVLFLLFVFSIVVETLLCVCRLGLADGIVFLFVFLPCSFSGPQSSHDDDDDDDDDDDSLHHFSLSLSCVCVCV